jgi:hypothetical protein
MFVIGKTEKGTNGKTKKGTGDGKRDRRFFI